MQSLKENHTLLSWKAAFTYSGFILTSLVMYSLNAMRLVTFLLDHEMVSGLQLLILMLRLCSEPASPLMTILSFTQVVSQNVLVLAELLLQEAKKTAAMVINKKFFIKK